MAVKSFAIKPGDLAEPVPTLALRDAVGMIVGIVVGAGIFRTPTLVAQNVTSDGTALLLWLAGGVVSLIGALCYAELTTTYPHTGGDYHYLTRAYGRPLSFLFVWSRVTVIQTGSLALLAYVFGDYVSQLFSIVFSNKSQWFSPEGYAPSIFAALVVVLLTSLNVLGVRHGTRTQNFLTAIEVTSLVLIIVAGLFLIDTPVTQITAPSQTSKGAVGLAMVFVLLTYGGWNEAAYISAETNGRRDVARALVFSILLITGLYLLTNWAYLRGLGLAGVAGSNAVAADLMQRALGQSGAILVSLLVAISALTSANATAFTGARTNYAFGRDFRLFRFLGRWNKRANSPVNALVVQGVIALVLILIGASTRKGFETMVEYTAPVFWFFFFMVGLSIIVLRIREPQVTRPFRMPLYPLFPVLFCASCLYMLRASLLYTEIGALVGLAVLISGIPVFLLARTAHRHAATEESATDKHG